MSAKGHIQTSEKEKPRRFMPDGPIPIVPIMLNTYYPPDERGNRRSSVRRYVAA